jgi:hypothetical protein
VKVLLPVVDRLRDRFGITRACVVADRGMISAATIAALEERGMEYILGARERSSSVIRDIVLNDTAPMVPLVIERQKGETQLWVKEVKVGKQRYIVSRNDAEAEKDRAERQAVVTGLEAQLKKGDKALVGNSAIGATCAAPTPARLSRLIPASSPTKPASTASLCSGPTRRSRRCGPSCAIATSWRSRDCSAPPRRASTHDRSSTNPTPLSAVMSWCAHQIAPDSAEWKMGGGEILGSLG